MFNFKALALTALTAVTFGATAAPKAEARGCYVGTAAAQMERQVRGGATIEQAIRWAAQDGLLLPGDRCFYELRGYIAAHPYVFPALHGR